MNDDEVEGLLRAAALVDDPGPAPDKLRTGVAAIPRSVKAPGRRRLPGWLPAAAAIVLAAGFSGTVLLLRAQVPPTASPSPSAGRSAATSPLAAASATAPPAPTPAPTTPTAALEWTDASSDQLDGAALDHIVRQGTGYLGVSVPWWDGTTMHPTIWHSNDGLTWQRLPDSPALAETAHGLIVEVSDLLPTGSGYLAVGMRAARAFGGGSGAQYSGYHRTAWQKPGAGRNRRL